VHLSAVFCSTGESTPSLGPGILPLTLVTGLTLTLTLTSASKQQVLAGLLSIDLCPSGLCRLSQRPLWTTPTASTRASTHLHQGVSRSARRGYQQQSATHSFEGCVTIEKVDPHRWEREGTTTAITH
jgi:hypothetical protein